MWWMGAVRREGIDRLCLFYHVSYFSSATLLPLPSPTKKEEEEEEKEGKKE
jgi:hypothetical protein